MLNDLPQSWKLTSWKQLHFNFNMWGSVKKCHYGKQNSLFTTSSSCQTITQVSRMKTAKWLQTSIFILILKSPWTAMNNEKPQVLHKHCPSLYTPRWQCTMSCLWSLNKNPIVGKMIDSQLHRVMNWPIRHYEQCVYSMRTFQGKNAIDLYWDCGCLRVNPHLGRCRRFRVHQFISPSSNAKCNVKKSPKNIWQSIKFFSLLTLKLNIEHCNAVLFAKKTLTFGIEFTLIRQFHVLHVVSFCKAKKSMSCNAHFMVTTKQWVSLLPNHISISLNNTLSWSIVPIIKWSKT